MVLDNLNNPKVYFCYFPAKCSICNLSLIPGPKSFWTPTLKLTLVPYERFAPSFMLVAQSPQWFHDWPKLVIDALFNHYHQAVVTNNKRKIISQFTISGFKVRNKNSVH